MTNTMEAGIDHIATGLEIVGDEERKESKTEWLRNWLDSEIEECNTDIRVLQGARYDPDTQRALIFNQNPARYGGLTCEEFSKKVERDRSALAHREKRLALLESGRELDVDVDRIALILDSDVSVDVNIGMVAGLPLITFSFFALMGETRCYVSFAIDPGTRRVKVHAGSNEPFAPNLVKFGLEKVSFNFGVVLNFVEEKITITRRGIDIRSKPS